MGGVFLFIMASKCTEVSELCPVKYTTLGYYPNKPLNIFCSAAFGVALIIQLVFGVWKRTWAFTGFIVAGCALEMAGAYSLSLSLHRKKNVVTAIKVMNLPESAPRSQSCPPGRGRAEI